MHNMARWRQAIVTRLKPTDFPRFHLEFMHRGGSQRERGGEVDKGPSLVRFSSGKKANETCDSAMNLMRLR